MPEKISVIVPVYNTQKYLEQCVHSVLRQDYENIELILVNDGSTDGSGALCAQLAAQDLRVTALDKKNGGLSDARNFGLAHAVGEWVLFLDSDDCYENDTLVSRLVQCAQDGGFDVVCFNYKRLYEPSERLSKPLCARNAGATLEALVAANVYVSSACLKLVRRTVLGEHELGFEKGALSEDIEYSARLMIYADKIGYCGEVCYLYREREGSISKTVSAKHVEDLVRIIDRCRTLFGRCDNETTRLCGLSYTAFQYCTLLINMQLGGADSAVRKRVYEMRGLLQYDYNSVVRLVKRCSSIFGIRLTARLLLACFKIKG